MPVFSSVGFCSVPLALGIHSSLGHLVVYPEKAPTAASEESVFGSSMVYTHQALRSSEICDLVLCSSGKDETVIITD